MTAYDSINNLYEIKYIEGEIDDFTYEELRKYRKTQQKYRKVLKLKRIETTTTKRGHEHDIFFISTKANPLKMGLQQKILSFPYERTTL